MPDDLAADRPDAAGDLPEGAGTVGQPHANDVGLHGRATYGGTVNEVFPAWHGPENWPAGPSS